VGWRRGLIRFVLACNWTVAGLSFGLGWYPHVCEWWATADELSLAEQGKSLPRGKSMEPGDWQELRAARPRADEHFRPLTERLFRSGLNGWWTACISSAATAVLLMIAFPQKPKTDEPGA
jgi:hypothetical protein